MVRKVGNLWALIGVSWASRGNPNNDSILLKGRLILATIHDLSYIQKTESYIQERQSEMPKQVYDFIKQVCQDERKYIDLVNQLGKEKKVFKV